MNIKEKIIWVILIVVLVIMIITPVKGIFLSYIPKYFYLLLISASLSYILCPIMIILAQKFNIIDKPQGRKKHEVVTPLLGGVGIYISFALTLWVNDYFSPQLIGVVVASTVVFSLGLADDIWKLSSRFKLLIQLLAVVILILYDVKISFLPHGIVYDIIEMFLTALWVIGITNAVNFLDGLDGLASGTSAINAMFFGLIAFQTNIQRTKQYFMMYIAYSLMGSCIGFLHNNFRFREKARIFLGDSGSFFLGFTLASIGLMGTWAENQNTALLIPVIVLAHPIFDTTLITILRIKEGTVRNITQWFDYAGWDHFHHRLVDLGIGKKWAVLVIYIICTWLGLNAMILKNADGLHAWYSIIQLGIVFILFTSFMVHKEKTSKI